MNLKGIEAKLKEATSNADNAYEMYQQQFRQFMNYEKQVNALAEETIQLRKKLFVNEEENPEVSECGIASL